LVIFSSQYSFYKKMKILSILVALIFASSCQANKTYDLKSPCVDNGGPCVRKPVNTWLTIDKRGNHRIIG